MSRSKIVVLTGAGMSAESGIATFRGAEGLWEGHRVEDVASPQGWAANRELVLDFYNQRRKAIYEASPNRGHEILAELEDDFDVEIVTQNIDNLHERAGSTKVLHLHGEIFQSRSSLNPKLIYDINGWELNEGEKCEMGSQLRPNIVWFGESVPMIEPAAQLVSRADVFVVVGTSLAVYPAAGLVNFAQQSIPKFIIDPHIPAVHNVQNMSSIQLGAGEGLSKLKIVLSSL